MLKRSECYNIGILWPTRNCISALILLICVLSPFLFYSQVKPAAGKTSSASVTGRQSQPGGSSSISDCSLYFPLKPGASFRYLKTTRTAKKNYIRAFEVFHNYYKAKDRVIMGQEAKGYIREEFIRRLDNPADNKNMDIADLFVSGTLRREDRLYFACGSLDVEKGISVNYLAEAKEIVKQTSKVVGSYVEVTETYKDNSFVPSNVSYQEVPEVEYNKIGTGRFNVRVISTTNSADAFRKAGYTLDFQLENRMAMGSMGEMYTYENSYFEIMEQLPSKEVLGKQYKDILHFKEEIYEAKEKGSSAKGGLIAVNEYYYAKGVGLITMKSTEIKRLNTGSEQQILQNVFSFNDDSNIITVLELLPAGADALKMIASGEMLRNGATQARNEWSVPDSEPKTNMTDQFKKALDSLTGKTPEDLVGLWVAPYPNRVTEKVSYTFKADGTYEYSDYCGLYVVPESGHWRMNGNELQLLTDISTLEARKYQSVKIKRFNTTITNNEKAGKPAIKINREFFRVSEDEIPLLLKTMKPDWMVSSENAVPEGIIDKDIVGVWRVDYPNLSSHREYIFKADGTGTYVSENKRTKFRETQKFNWRLKGTTLFKQILCEQPPCPQGEKFIVREGCQKITVNNKPALYMGDRGKYIKQ